MCVHTVRIVKYIEKDGHGWAPGKSSIMVISGECGWSGGGPQWETSLYTL